MTSIKKFWNKNRKLFIIKEEDGLESLSPEVAITLSTILFVVFLFVSAWAG